MPVKQVLLWRKDLRNSNGQKVRSGKMAAQLAHASMAAILNRGEIMNQQYVINMNADMREWLTGRFTKVCVEVSTEQELLDMYAAAKSAGLPCSLIQDAGLTEFDNIPTYTAVAIGPAQADKIDAITGHLHLL